LTDQAHRDTIKPTEVFYKRRSGLVVKGEKRRQQILDTAEALFYQRGYENTASRMYWTL
jgi:AcrR family transcriptional regulator